MTRDTSLRARMDPARRQIGSARWLIWLFGLATPGFTALLIAATWAIVSDNKPGWGMAVGLLALWIVFVGLLIAPGTWYVIRTWRHIPVLQVDAWGLVWGDDWSRDLAIEWRDIASITSRRVRSQGYSDRWLLIHPRGRAIQPNLSALLRFTAWLSRAMYGTPYIIGLGTMRIGAMELIELILTHYDGEIDLSAIGP